MKNVEDIWKDGYSQGFQESKDAYNRLKYANMNEIRKQKAEIYKLKNEIKLKTRWLIIIMDGLLKAIRTFPDGEHNYLSYISEKCFRECLADTDIGALDNDTRR